MLDILNRIPQEIQRQIRFACDYVTDIFRIMTTEKTVKSPLCTIYKGINKVSPITPRLPPLHYRSAFPLTFGLVALFVPVCVRVCSGGGGGAGGVCVCVYRARARACVHVCVCVCVCV